MMTKLPKGVEARAVRLATMERATLDEEGRTVQLAFSSEQPVERWWGVEILGHAAGEMDDEWMRSGTAPLLMDHNARDQVGVVESVTLDADRKARATVRFGRSERAQEIMRDVADGIRSNISVGYELLELRLESEEKGKPPVYRATRWKPLEMSFVSIPADMTVGVGRDAAATTPTTIPAQPKQEARMPDADTIEAPPRAPTADEINQAAQRRVQEMLDLGAIANARDAAITAIGKGLTIEQFRGQLLLEREGKAKPLGAPPTEIGLGAKEVRRFSLARLLVAQAERNAQIAPFEMECVEATRAKLQTAGMAAKYNPLPSEILEAPIPGLRVDERGMVVAGSGQMQRDLSTATVTAGGAFVATDLLATSFIELLRNAMMVRAMGCTILSGLQGNVAIPRQTGATTAGWVAQGGAATESDMTFSQVTMTLRTVHAIQDFTRDLLLQSSLDIEALVRMDLALVIAIALDRAALHGTGTGNQPTGLALTAGIGSVAGGVNGLIPTWDNIVDLETQVANQNGAVDRLGYLTNSRVRGRLKRQPIIAGQPVFVWGGMPGAGQPFGPGTTPIDRMSVMNEYAAGVSNNVRSDLDKGTSTGICSAIFYGNWRDLIMGEWGVLETLPDNITQAANRIIRVHAYQSADVAVRKPQSFSAMLDALT